MNIHCECVSAINKVIVIVKYRLCLFLCKVSLYYITAYNRVVVIPKGASSITIQEMGISPNNFLVLRDNYGKYLLNGDWHLNKEGLYNIQGTRFVYRRTYNKPESLEAEGPLIEDLILEVHVLCCSGSQGRVSIGDSRGRRGSGPP